MQIWRNKKEENSFIEEKENLREAVNIFNYINTPVTGEYTLHKDMYGRYGCEVVTFSAGSSIEALIVEDERQYWIHTRVEHDGNDYYLVRYPNVPLEGLKIRRRW